ncbi:hypothetical protein GCM10011498_37700 [Amylibacter cionae]|uniref:Uncharacterized protein n=1 Tax=Neptunicoccus cionae TaxID=2035344 RepID=A0A916R493_9RHOB|nr:hypothetical protein GCM10011498_37700 [Amylibacter cionae]
MGERDAEAVDLAFLVGGQPHTTVIWTTARDRFGKGKAGQQNKYGSNKELIDQTNSPICRSGWNIRAR